MYGNILAIDRGSRQIGLARRSDTTKIILPIGRIYNDEHLDTSLGSLLQKYTIDTAVLGTTKNPKHQQALEKIRQLLKNLSPEIQCFDINEAYTSIQADIILEQTDHPGQDSVAAMYILEYFLESEKSSEKVLQKG